MRLYLVYALGGYLCGSLMLARWLPLFLFGTDTVAGSDDRNPGVYNAFRQGGLKCGVPALLGDLMKGFVPVFLAARRLDAGAWMFALVMAAPVIGHVLPLFARFRGGKGITASFGVMLALWRVDNRLLLLLAGLYIFFSVAVVIDTHLWRSVTVYALFGVLALGLIALPGLKLGCALIALTVAARHAFARADDPLTVRLRPFHRG